MNDRHHRVVEEDLEGLGDLAPPAQARIDGTRSVPRAAVWSGRPSSRAAGTAGTQNIDSANHRAHVAFADPATGACPNGLQAIPQLVQRLVYDVDAPSLNDNGRSSAFYAVDGFPEQMHKPITDHGDFVNVFDEQLMNTMVECINTGRECR